jgi:hypothetical protein
MLLAAYHGNTIDNMFIYEPLNKRPDLVDLFHKEVKLLCEARLTHYAPVRTCDETCACVISSLVFQID